MKTVSAARKTKKTASSAALKRQEKAARRAKDNAAYLVAFALVIVVFICYANSLGNDFVFGSAENRVHPPVLHFRV